MCCDGTLFPIAAAGAEEAPLLDALGLTPAVSATGDRGFRLPCPRFQDGCCSVYSQQRPEVCGAYRCALLPAYEAGAYTLDDCLDVIDEVRDVSHRLGVLTGVAPDAFTAAAYQDYCAAHPIEPGDDVDQELAMVAFRLGRIAADYFGWSSTTVPVGRPDDPALGVTPAREVELGEQSAQVRAGATRPAR
jgi:hypothetical protein